jgi:hypothetical protein
VEQLITGGGGQDRTWGVADYVKRTMGLAEGDLDAEALKTLAAAHEVGVGGVLFLCVDPPPGGWLAQSSLVIYPSIRSWHEQHDRSHPTRTHTHT